jgi:ribosomal protein S18 acetylase RimI-like enzyme
VITIRPETSHDEPFLFDLYSSTRHEELDAWGWTQEARLAFLAMQFKASQSLRSAFPDAEFDIIVFDGVNAGRLVLHRTPHELRIVDIALLSQYRNAGIGTVLLHRILDEGIATKRTVRLTVRNGNRAARLYARIGFEKISETEMHIEMEWRPRHV